MDVFYISSKDLGYLWYKIHRKTNQIKTALWF